MRKTFTITGTLTKYPVPAAWHYVALSKKLSARLAAGKTMRKKGWGYVPLHATLGKTTWFTALWPKRHDGVYLLVVNKEVRTKEKKFAGQEIKVKLVLA